MKTLIFLIFILAFIAPAQQIKNSVFTNGAGVSNNSGFIVNSNISQNFIGLSSNSSIVVGSGFFYGVNYILSVETEEGLPTEYRLYQNFPNPFNPSTTIKFSIPEPNQVILKIYDIVGSEVTTLLNQQMETGNYSITFNSPQLASGIYFYRMISGNFITVKKMMMLK